MDLVIAFSGSDVTNFVILSGSGAVVIVVFGVVVFIPDFRALKFEVYSVNRLRCHKQAVVVVDDYLFVAFLVQVLKIFSCHLFQVLSLLLSLGLLILH